jgi:glycosyltransferase involved in cell wall biosynthesis
LDRLINRFFMQPLEKHLIRSCSLVTTAAPALREELRELHPHLRIEVIYNGFFPEMFAHPSREKRKTAKQFTIAYAGTIYSYQKLELFLDGVSMLIDKRRLSPEEFRLLFIGLDFQSGERNRLFSHDGKLVPFISTTKRLTQQETINLLAESDLTLILTSRQYSPIPAKLFDYLSLGKPILMCENDRASVEEILTDCGSGLIADTPEEVCALIGRVFDHSFPVNPTHAPAKYSRKHQASILAQLLREIPKA